MPTRAITSHYRGDMGTNIFVEGLPAPVVVKLRFHTDPTTFRELRELLSDLAFVDTMQLRWWSTIWPSFSGRRRIQSRVLRFTKQSPPETNILCDPAWLAVFIALLAGYRNIKENVNEFYADGRKIIDGIVGLTARQRQLLEIAVRMTADRILQMSESAAERFLKAARRMRQNIVGDSGDLPDIEVIDIDRSIY